MCIWIEFRCANREQQSANGDGIGPRCESHDNNGPMELAGDNQADVIYALQQMSKYAKRDGWVKTKSGWVCSFCAKQLGLTPND